MLRKASIKKCRKKFWKNAVIYSYTNDKSG